MKSFKKSLKHFGRCTEAPYSMLQEDLLVKQSFQFRRSQLLKFITKALDMQEETETSDTHT